MNRTSGENIGDTGLIQAFRAWKEQFKVSLEAGNEDLLPGLHFTRYDPTLALHLFLYKFHREQLFFISFARVWANAMKPAAAVGLMSFAKMKVTHLYRSNEYVPTLTLLTDIV